jgi:hypothetical protein
VRNDRAERQAKLVQDLAEQYGRLTKAGIEKFARAVPARLFLAVDRLVAFHAGDEPAPQKAPAIGTVAARKAPSLRTKRVAKKTVAKKTVAKKTAAKKSSRR